MSICSDKTHFRILLLTSLRNLPDSRLEIKNWTRACFPFSLGREIFQNRSIDPPRSGSYSERKSSNPSSFWPSIFRPIPVRRAMAVPESLFPSFSKDVKNLEMGQRSSNRGGKSFTALNPIFWSSSIFAASSKESSHSTVASYLLCSY